MRCLNGVADFQFYEVQYHGVRLVVCVIESAKTKPIAFSGSPYIRVESYTKLLVDFPELEKRLWNSLLQSSFESEIAAK
jgi:predicted HTH transcriptional regulator